MSEVTRYFEVFGASEEEVVTLLHREMDEHGYKPRWGITVYPPQSVWSPGSVEGISAFIALCKETYALPIYDREKVTK